MTRFFLILIFAPLLACSEKNQSSQEISTSIKSNLKKCESEPNAKFSWNWCQQNELEESRINEVCYGTLLFEDMLFFAVQLKSKINSDNSYQCLFSNGPSKDSESSDCARVIEREYMAAYGDENTTKINECIDNDGERFKIFGTGLLGEKFLSSKK